MKLYENPPGWSSAEKLRAAIPKFIELYSQAHNREQIGNIAPTDAYYEQREEILNAGIKKTVEYSFE